MPINTLIVDDHQLVLDGIKLMLEGHEQIVVIGEAHNGQEAIDFVSAHEVDVVVMDLNMPEVNGIDACKAIKNCKQT